MSLNRWSKARDANEPEVVAALEQLGAKVWRLDTPFDLLVGWRSMLVLVEVKLPLGPEGGSSHSPLTDPQIEDLRICRDRDLPYLVTRSDRDAVEKLTALWARRNGGGP